MDRIIFLAVSGIAVRSFFSAIITEIAYSHAWRQMEGVSSGRCIFVWVHSDFRIEL